MHTIECYNQGDQRSNFKTSSETSTLTYIVFVIFPDIEVSFLFAVSALHTEERKDAQMLRNMEDRLLLLLLLISLTF